MQKAYYQFVLNPEGEIVSFTRTKVTQTNAEGIPDVVKDSRGVTSIGVFVDESVGPPGFLHEMLVEVGRYCKVIA